LGDEGGALGVDRGLELYLSLDCKCLVSLLHWKVVQPAGEGAAVD
jgi:hypothetical protein